MMKRTSKVWVAMTVTLTAAAVTFAPVAARANTDTRANAQSKLIQPVQPLTVADNVVVSPNQPQQPAPAAPAPAPGTVVVPQAAAPAPAPVEAAPRTNTVVGNDHSYVGTIFVSTLLGGLAGALIGASIWYLADDQEHPARIGYWAAGGVLVGGAIGVTQIVIQEGRTDRAVASLPRDPAPTFRLALFQRQF